MNSRTDMTISGIAASHAKRFKGTRRITSFGYLNTILYTISLGVLIVANDNNDVHVQMVQGGSSATG